jgi:hypothetical protein
MNDRRIPGAFCNSIPTIRWRSTISDRLSSENARSRVEQAKAAYERFLQNWKSADADIPEIVEAKKQFATGLAAIDSEALNGWSQAGRAVAKQSLTSLGKPEVTVDGHD